MKSAFRTYSDVLLFRSDVIRKLLDSPRGIAYALKLFVIVLLIAGLGVWFGLPNSLAQPTLSENADRLISSARDAGQAVVAPVVAALTSGKIEAASQAVVSKVQETVNPIVTQLNTLFGGLITGADTVDRLLQKSSVTADEIERVVSNTRVTAAQMGELLDKAQLPTAQVDALLAKANLTSAQVQQARTEAGAAIDQALANLTPILTALAMSPAEFKSTLEKLSVTPEQVDEALEQYAIKPEQIAQVVDEIDLKAAEVNAFAEQIQQEVIKAEPPIGERPSRVVRMTGNWLATPFQFATEWVFFGLALLVVAKSLGGKATLPQHVGALALATAPAVLLLGSYMPDVNSSGLIPYSIALHYFGQLVALIGVVWMALLLLRTVGTAHGFGMWKSLGAVALTGVVLFVVAPLFLAWATGFLLS